jgi:hypothetical protein
MPKQKAILELIPRIYRKNFENLSIFFWVEAQKNILPNISVSQSIQKYITFTKMDLDIETAITIYQRLKKEYLNDPA